jgi:large subunit ribosomal protein L15
MSTISDITTGLRNKRPTRKGRGRSAGKGKTAGRGGKGSSARQGSPHWKPGHEGGQTSTFRRFPKRGFSNAKFERRFHIVNLVDLAAQFEDGAVVDAPALEAKGLIPDLKQPVKILGHGEFSKKLTIHAGWYSKSAHERIGQAGGTALDAKGEAFAFPKPKKKFVPRDEPKKGSTKKKTEEAAPAAEGEQAK